MGFRKMYRWVCLASRQKKIIVSIREMVWKLHCLSRWRNGHVIVLEGLACNTWRWRTTLINPNVVIGWLLHYTQNTIRSVTVKENNDFCGASKPSPSTNYDKIHLFFFSFRVPWCRPSWKEFHRFHQKFQFIFTPKRCRAGRLTNRAFGAFLF